MINSSLLSAKELKKGLNNLCKRIAPALLLLLATLGAGAQQVRDPAVQMADVMRSNGKIYVVVAVLLTVLVGLFIYVIRLDRKISKLEKQSGH